MESADRVRELERRAESLEAEVNQHKRVEAELSGLVVEQARRSAESAELLRRLVESIRDYAIFMLDPHGNVATWNPGAERIKGFKSHEIVGRHFSVFYLEEEIRAGKCEYELEVAAREGRFEDEGWRLRGDGSRFWANVVITAVRDEAGELLGFAKVTRDLTDRRRVEEERAARIAAERANVAKDEFLAMLGHELRNPLAPIVTALQLMKLRGEGGSREQQIIERQVRHMMHLIDDLLDVSRITKGKITLTRERVDVRDVLSKALEIASPLLEQRRHHLMVGFPEKPTFVDGDDARLTQVVANLVVNAAKYTPSGGHIRVAVAVRDGNVVIEVQDDGMGIAPELLPRVFDLFVQGYQGVERTSGGLGIGLTLVRTLVAMHGGTVSADSAGEGKGSTFRVTLPLSATRSTTPSERPSSSVVEKASRVHRVLIVDDNEDAVALLAEILSAAGHVVQTACDAPRALELTEQFEPDVAILDIGLPVMDGYELAARIRERLGAATPRLIALSGYGQPNDREKSREAGFDVHLVKPTDAQRILDAIVAKDRSA